MADYNVQMKQYNGTSFDNILPYASQALTLAGGGSATEIIAQARAGLSQIATGSYVGNGTYGQDNPTVITCGFKPKMVLVYMLNQLANSVEMNGTRKVYGVGCAWWVEGVKEAVYPDITTISFTQTEVGLSLYAPDPQYVTYHGEYQNNASGSVYYYIALG